MIICIGEKIRLYIFSNYYKGLIYMKKLIICLITIIIVCFSFTTAFAAGINSSEASVLRNMRSPADMNGNKVYVPASYINQAEANFNTIDMTPAQAGRINSIIGQARAFLKGTGKSKVSELSSSERQKLMNYASAAASVLKLSAAAGSNTKNVKIISKSGGVVVDDSNNVIKTTGQQESPVVFITVSALAVLFISASSFIIISSKKASAYEKTN